MRPPGSPGIGFRCGVAKILESAGNKMVITFTGDEKKRKRQCLYPKAAL
jgi:hypothetical protein